VHALTVARAGQTDAVPAPSDLPVLAFPTAAEFEQWLEREHATAAGVWLRFPRKGTGVPSLTYEEAVHVALCFGWIDGQARSLDETAWLQRYTPRRRRSIWSQINRERVARLVEQGRMRPAGLAEVERAKADGRWDAAYAPPSTATVPPELAAALEASPAAAEAFAALDSRNRYAILHRVATAKKPETRARRTATFVGMLERGELLYPKGEA
jgi:uncharacterized protein YdeI (YjbR/CyaY-like superfamily)